MTGLGAVALAITTHFAEANERFIPQVGQDVVNRVAIAPIEHGRVARYGDFIRRIQVRSVPQGRERLSYGM